MEMAEFLIALFGIGLFVVLIWASTRSPLRKQTDDTADGAENAALRRGLTVFGTTFLAGGVLLVTVVIAVIIHLAGWECTGGIGDWHFGECHHKHGGYDVAKVAVGIGGVAFAGFILVVGLRRR